MCGRIIILKREIADNTNCLLNYDVRLQKTWYFWKHDYCEQRHGKVHSKAWNISTGKISKLFGDWKKLKVLYISTIQINQVRNDSCVSHCQVSKEPMANFRRPWAPVILSRICYHGNNGTLLMTLTIICKQMARVNLQTVFTKQQSPCNLWPKSFEGAKRGRIIKWNWKSNL